MVAGQSGAAARLARVCRRGNKAFAAMLAALIVVFLAGFAGVTLQVVALDGEAARAGNLAKAEAKARDADGAATAAPRGLVAERELRRRPGPARPKGRRRPGPALDGRGPARDPGGGAPILRGWCGPTLAGWEEQVPRVLRHP